MFWGSRNEEQLIRGSSSKVLSLLLFTEIYGRSACKFRFPQGGITCFSKGCLQIEYGLFLSVGIPSGIFQCAAAPTAAGPFKL